MQITRRTLIGAAAAAGASSLLPRATWAQTSMSLSGGMQLDVVSDGNLVLPGGFVMAPLEVEAATAALAAAGLGTESFSPPCNLTLLRNGARTVLFDAGSGPNFMPTAGQIYDALDALGVAPEEVTDVVLTHGHPDHLWGVLDDFDDLFYPEAQYYMGRTERDYWLNPNTVDTIDAGRQAFAAGALRHLGEIAERLTVFEDGDEVLPGIGARASFGHTPGHMSFDVGGEVFVVGDAIGNAHLALSHPDWPSGSDQDMDMGRGTRLDLLAGLAASGQPMVGFHLPGGLGRVDTDGDAYRFVVSV